MYIRRWCKPPIPPPPHTLFLPLLWQTIRILCPRIERAISHFPTMFLIKQIIVSPFVHLFAVISLFSTKLEKPKIGISGKDFKSKTVIETVIQRIYLFIFLVCFSHLPLLEKKRQEKYTYLSFLDSIVSVGALGKTDKKNIYPFVYRKYIFIFIVSLYDLPPYRYIGKNRQDKKGRLQ